MSSHPPPRRVLLLQGSRMAAALALAAAAGQGRAAASGSRALALTHLHTRESLSLVYAQAGAYVPSALRSLNRFLRDHYSGAVGTMDPALFDLLHRVQSALRWQGRYEIISGYRSAATNQHLRQTRGGGVASGSLHLQGRALDVRLPGVPLAELRDAALALHAGGVGYYPREQFVHLDTGRVRRW